MVVFAHFDGQSFEMESMYKLSKRYGFKIIEGISHAIGAKYEDEYVEK